MTDYREDERYKDIMYMAERWDRAIDTLERRTHIYFTNTEKKDLIYRCIQEKGTQKRNMESMIATLKRTIDDMEMEEIL